MSDASEVSPNLCYSVGSSLSYYCHSSPVLCSVAFGWVIAITESVLVCSIAPELLGGCLAACLPSTCLDGLGSVFASLVSALVGSVFDLSTSSCSSLACCFHDAPVFHPFSKVGSDPSIPSTLDSGGLVVSYPVSSHPLLDSSRVRDSRGPLGLGLACWVATGHQWH